MKCVLRNLYDEIEYLLFSTLWLVIIFPKPIQMVIYGGILILLLVKYNFKIKLTVVSVFMLILSVVHMFSIVYNVTFGHHDIGRIFAAINTALLWGIGSVYYSIYSKNNFIDIKKIGKYCCINILILFAFAIWAIYLYYFAKLDKFNFCGKTLYVTTYLAGKAKIKFIGLNDFSNMNLFYIMLMFMYGYSYIKDKKIIFKIMFFMISIIEVWLIHSRSGMVLFSLCIAYVLLMSIKNRHRAQVVLVSMGLLFLIGLLNYDLIMSIFIDKILYGNESSTNFRILLMKTSIEEAWSISPVWGVGIKRYLYEGYPLGSHSTYVGFFYKTGILGLFLGMYAIIYANWIAYKRNKKNWVVAFLICFFVLFGIEDVDGANWSIVLYFSTLAILSNREITEMKGKNSI